jgi:hypothetical protein
MLWINLLALGLTGVGFAFGWIVISHRRRPYRLEGALLSWDENPPSIVRYDKFGAVLIAAHAASIIALSLLLVCSVNRTASSPVSMGFESPGGRWLKSTVGIDDPQVRRLSFTAASLAAGIGGFLLGTIVVFPIVRWRHRPVTVHIHPNGVLYGQVATSWEEIGRWQADPERRLVRLYSSADPHALSEICHPPTDNVFGEAVRLLGELVPDRRVDEGIAWHRHKGAPALAFLIGIAGALIVAGWAYQYVAEWVWLLYAVEIILAAQAGRLLPRL